MTDNNPYVTPPPPPPPPAPKAGWFDPGIPNVQLIYVLYLISFAVGITGLVAIILAYINRGKSEAWVETHYSWAIRTFWIGMLYAFISLILMVIGIGFILMFVVAIWVVIRCVIGLQAASRNEPIKNPQSWIV